MAKPSVAPAQVQLREQLLSLRTRVGMEAKAIRSSTLDAHRRVDNAIKQRVHIATAPSRRLKRGLVVGVLLLIVGYYVAFTVLPPYSQSYESFLTRAMGKSTYSVQRLLRFTTLPIMYKLPRIAEFMYNPSCSISNPYYVTESDVEQEEQERVVSLLRSRKKKPGQAKKPKASGADEMAVGGGRLALCSCIGVRSAGRIKNRTALKMKHLLKDSGVPLVLRVDESAESTSRRLVSLLTALKEHRDNLTENLCFVKPLTTEGFKCSGTVASVIDGVLGNKPNDLRSLHYTWSYCRASADAAAAYLKKAVDPASYLLTKNIVYSASPSLVISKAVNDTRDADMPDTLMVDLDIAAYHQIAGRRKFTLTPASCKRCRSISVQLSAGDVLFFHSSVWNENPRQAVVLDGDTDTWSITYGYSIGSSKTELAPIYDTPDWEDEESVC